MVLLSGEPWIGRLTTAALLERLASEPHTLFLFLFSAAHGQCVLSDH